MKIRIRKKSEFSESLQETLRYEARDIAELDINKDRCAIVPGKGKGENKVASFAIGYSEKFEYRLSLRLGEMKIMRDAFSRMLMLNGIKD